MMFLPEKVGVRICAGAIELRVFIEKILSRLMITVVPDVHEGEPLWFALTGHDEVRPTKLR